MQLNELGPSVGSTKGSKRVGRGDGSGRGTYSGRGSKGQKGHHKGVRPGFEGGQLALIKRLPRKRGFHNVFRIEFNVVNVGALNVFADGAEVTPKEMCEVGLIRSLAKPTKILARGDMEKKLTVSADKFSVAAEEKIRAAEGTVKKA
ncbi:50S ribosomal protein L15 [Candidatus Bipolaricaulota bacterium]|nr:50S ribosomal protein L15 [Dehalococcoidia bacterium]MCK5586811.1 50S ribosomal protein L15 [Candidatus Bipolaricaulota bacterium]